MRNTPNILKHFLGMKEKMQRWCYFSNFKGELTIYRYSSARPQTGRPSVLPWPTPQLLVWGCAWVCNWMHRPWLLNASCWFPWVSLSFLFKQSQQNRQNTGNPQKSHFVFPWFDWFDDLKTAQRATGFASHSRLCCTGGLLDFQHSTGGTGLRFGTTTLQSKSHRADAEAFISFDMFRYDGHVW